VRSREWMRSERRVGVVLRMKTAKYLGWIRKENE
jgi:hypothetical protein